MDRIAHRPAESTDARFLTDMLVEAKNWNSLRSRPRLEILENPRARRYVTGWMRPGDCGVIAVDQQGAAVGACWARIFPADAPGGGFVAAGVPELVLGVRPLWRAQGIGRTLLRELMSVARSRGFSRISLTVQHDNFAARLYVSEGFTLVDSYESADTMVRVLR